MIDWFAKRREGSVRSGSRSHLLAVYDAATELDNALKAMAASDEMAAMRCVDRLVVIEREADRIEDALSKDIVDGSLSSQSREDLLHFVKKTDHIANWANNVGSHVQLVVDTNTDVPNHLWEASRMMSEELKRTVKLLVDAVESLGKSKEDLLRNVDAIMDQERIIDQMFYNNFRKILLSDMDYRGVILMKAVMQGIEDASDACKSCANTLIVMTVARGE